MEKILDIAYNPQWDNKFQPWTECNVTSLNMVLNCDGLYPDATDDYLSKLLRSKEAHDYAKKLIRRGEGWITPFLSNNELRQVWSMLNWACRKIIGDGDPDKGRPYSNFFTDLPVSVIRDEIDKGYPVVLSGNFYNLARTARYSHIMVAIGYTNSSIVCHDPAGSLMRNKQGDFDYYARYFNGVSGSTQFYPNEWIQQCLSGTRDMKWMLLVHADKKMAIEVPLDYTLDIYRRI